jgi:hypothetical protein
MIPDSDAIAAASREDADRLVALAREEPAGRQCSRQRSFPPPTKYRDSATYRARRVLSDWDTFLSDGFQLPSDMAFFLGEGGRRLARGLADVTEEDSSWFFRVCDLLSGETEVPDEEIDKVSQTYWNGLHDVLEQQEVLFFPTVCWAELPFPGLTSTASEEGRALRSYYVTDLRRYEHNPKGVRLVYDPSYEERVVDELYVQQAFVPTDLGSLRKWWWVKRTLRGPDSKEQGMTAFMSSLSDVVKDGQ